MKPAGLPLPGRCREGVGIGKIRSYRTGNNIHHQVGTRAPLLFPVPGNQHGTAIMDFHYRAGIFTPASAAFHRAWNKIGTIIKHGIQQNGMKSGIAILLILFCCIACVHAAPPTQSCAQPYSGSCGNMPNGNVYFYLNLPVSDDTVFLLGNDKLHPTIKSLPAPYDAYTGYELGFVPGSYTITVRRPGYNDAAYLAEICDCKNSFINVVMVPTVTTTVTTAKTGFAVKPVVSGIALATTTATTTTPASSGSFAGRLQAPTIALQKATTTAATGGSQGSGSQTGGSGSQNTGTGTSGSGQTGASQSGSTGSGPAQTGSAANGGADTANTGSLSVTTTPAGVTIFIDGVQRGVSPATIPGLAPGEHTLLLKLDGYTDLSTPVSITAGKTTEYTTGLATAKKSPGFGAVFGIIALGVILTIRKMHSG